MSPVAIAMISTSVSIVAGGGCDGDGGPGGGSQDINGTVTTADQMDISQLIVNQVIARSLPRRAAVLAISTGIVESGLRNLDYGDRDSLGIFQQRPSQGWGTPAQILDPVYSTGKFLDALLAVPGWATMAPGAAQQAVQRSGFPDRYAPQEPHAEQIVDKFWTGPDNPVPPTPSDTSGPVAAASTGCPDQGGAGVPRTDIDPAKIPDGYQLPADPRQAAAVSFALGQLGKPYVWGAKGPTSYDCSGLMLAAWAAAGIGIPAGTISQVHAGRAVPSLAQLQPGDLVFIPGSLGTKQVPRHVGMYAGHGLIVNAFDSHTGVILQPLDDWTGDVVAIRRIAEPTTPSPTLGGTSGTTTTPHQLTGTGP
ncbi:C40 family peptidase [Saccharothrix sp. AJ9571]|nr:C40 family peptidase [Saccharothrix sp. AJ9571]